MAYRIQLTFATPSLMKFHGRDTFRVQVTASDAEDMPNEIFAHQRTLVDTVTSSYQDEFLFICSPYDLSIYPANAPNEEQSPPFFRKDTIDILVPGIEIAEQVVTEIQDQVAHLITLLNKLDELTTISSVWIPDAP